MDEIKVLDSGSLTARRRPYQATNLQPIKGIQGKMVPQGLVSNAKVARVTLQVK